MWWNNYKIQLREGLASSTPPKRGGWASARTDGAIGACVAKCWTGSADTHRSFWSTASATAATATLRFLITVIPPTNCKAVEVLHRRSQISRFLSCPNWCLTADPAGQGWTKWAQLRVTDICREGLQYRLAKDESVRHDNHAPPGVVLSKMPAELPGTTQSTKQLWLHKSQSFLKWSASNPTTYCMITQVFQVCWKNVPFMRAR